MDLRAHADELFASYSALTPEELHRAGVQLLHNVMHGTDESLAPLKVDAACLCALTAYTSGRPDAGLTFAAMADTWADSSGQRELIARAAGTKAIYYSATMGNGQPRQSTLLLKRAVDNAEPGVMRMWALLFLAGEYAAMGDTHRTLAALRVADQHTARGHGMGLFSTDGYLQSCRSPALLLGMSGRALALLGHGKSALFDLGDALSLNRAGPRLTAVLYVDSVLAHLAADQPEQACSAAQTALDMSEETGYALGVQRVKQARGRFPEPWAGLACVVELDDRLRLSGPMPAQG